MPIIRAWGSEIYPWPRVGERYDRIYQDAVRMARQVHDLEHSYAREATPFIKLGELGVAV